MAKTDCMVWLAKRPKEGENNASVEIVDDYVMRLAWTMDGKRTTGPIPRGLARLLARRINEALKYAKG